MKRSLLCLPSIWVGVVLPTVTLQAQGAGEIVTGRYIVQLKPGVSAAEAAQAHGVAADRVFGLAVNGYAGVIPPGLLEKVAGDPQVEAITPDRVVTLHARPGGGGGGAKEQTPLGIQRVGAPTAWSQGVTGAGVGVAIVDTGIDLLHPDLGGPIDAFSVYGESAQDDNGHGTHVAGTVAARRGNNLDVVGVAPEATLYAVKVLNAQGQCYDSDIIAGLNWIVANAAVEDPPIKVANLSLGRPGSVEDNPSLRAAFQSVVGAGVTVVVSAGNECSLEVSQNVPATYPEVIAVAATTAADGTTAYPSLKILKDTASYFTTDGAWNSGTHIGVTISAPGDEQENVMKGYRLSVSGILSTKLGGGTTRMSGTSMAAPHVAGVAALLHDKTPTLTPEGAREKLRAGADRAGVVPLASPTTCYTSDGAEEGVVYAPGALGL